MMDEVMPSEVLNKEYVRSVTANKGVQVKKKTRESRWGRAIRFLKLKNSGRSP